MGAKTKTTKGSEIRATLADALTTAAAAFKAGGMDAKTVSAGKLVVDSANALTNNLKAELQLRDQLIRMGVSANSIPEIGELTLA